MRKMYNKPQTQTLPMEPVSTLCNSTLVKFGTDAASGAALAPKRPNEFYNPR